jgi:hypothetical protein
MARDSRLCPGAIARMSLLLITLSGRIHKERFLVVWFLYICSIWKAQNKVVSQSHCVEVGAIVEELERHDYPFSHF